MPAAFMTVQKMGEAKALMCSRMMPRSKARIRGMNRIVEFMLFCGLDGKDRGYVKAQLPAVVVDDGDHLLGVNAVQGDEEGGQNSEDGTDQGEIDLAIRTDVKAKDYNGTARDDCQRGFNPEEQVTEKMTDRTQFLRQNNIEYNGQRPSHQVE